MATIDLTQDQKIVFKEIWNEVEPITQILQRRFGIDIVVDIKMRWLLQSSLNRSVNELYVWSNGGFDAPREYRENAFQVLAGYYERFLEIWERLRIIIGEDFNLKMVTFMPRGGPVFNRCGILCEMNDGKTNILYFVDKENIDN